MFVSFIEEKFLMISRCSMAPLDHVLWSARSIPSCNGKYV